MRLLADENFPGPAVGALRTAGHDVIWVRETSPGLADADVLAIAASEARILLTFDKDFGELAGTAVMPGTSGVVLFRLPMPRRRDAGRILAQVIAARDDWAGHVSVVEPGRVRMRPF